MRVVRLIVGSFFALQALVMSFMAFDKGLSWPGAFMLAAPLGIAYMVWPKRQKRSNAMQPDQQEAETLKYLNDANIEGRLPATSSTTILDRKDAVVLAAWPARLYEKVRSRDPRLKGPKATVTTDGVETTAALVASGELAITTSSLAFVSGSKSFDVKLAKLLTVQASGSVLLIAAQGRATPLILEVRNPRLCEMLIVNVLRIRPTGRELPPDTQLER